MTSRCSKIRIPASKGRVLVLENYRQTIVVIRSLAKLGFEVTVGREGRKAYTEYSRYTSEVWVHPPVLETTQFVSALKAFLSERADITHVFPLGEFSIKALLDEYEELSQRVTIVIASPNVAGSCLDKPSAYALVNELEIPLPKTEYGTTGDEIRAGAAKVGFPCILKLRNSFKMLLGRKAIVCENMGDLASVVHRLSENHDELIIQRFASGFRHNCNYAAVRGKVQAYFEHKVLRTDRLDGCGYIVDAVTVPPNSLHREYCARIAERLSYTGVGCMQFLFDDATLETNFLELNPRLDATCYVPFRCGYDFPKLAIECAEAMKDPDVKVEVVSHYGRNKRFHWLLGDTHALLAAFLAREISPRDAMRWALRIVYSAARANHFLGWSWKDPLPTLVLYFEFVGTMFHKVRKIVFR